MDDTALKRMTVDEFLVWDGEGDRRYELIGGEIVTMPLNTNAHGVITVNVGSEIARRLSPPNRVLMATGIRLPFRNDTYYQADIAITASRLEPRRQGISDPVIIIEVVSPATAVKDLSLKSVDYRRIDSVQEMVFVATEEKQVEHWRRGEGMWIVTDLDATDRREFATFGFDFPVEALYDGLDFSQGVAAQS